MSSSRSAWDVETLVIVAECNSQGRPGKNWEELQGSRANCHPERSEGSASCSLRSLEADPVLFGLASGMSSLLFVSPAKSRSLASLGMTHKLIARCADLARIV